jgi:hypothetical protein
MRSNHDEDIRLLETGGLVGAGAASPGSSDDWPGPFLCRANSQVGLEVPTAAVRVLISDACVLASALDVVPRAAALATAHAKAAFSRSEVEFASFNRYLGLMSSSCLELVTRAQERRA